MRKLEILYLVDFLRTDQAGTEKQLVLLMKHLPRDVYSIHLISFQRSVFLENLGLILPDVHVFVLDAKSDVSRSLPSLFRLYRFLRKKKPDILHTFFPASNSFGVIVGRMAGVSHIISSRRDMGFWQTKKDLLVTRFANRLVSHVVANSFAVKEQAVRIERLPEHKISVICNSLDNKKCPIPVGAKVEKNGAVVGIVANLNRPVKRVDLFIHAASLVYKEIPDTRFWVVGDGPLREDLDVLVSNLGLDSSVLFLGQREDVHQVLNEMTVGVICSDSEGFSNAIMEYMGAGLPVVATNVGGNVELVRHGENGFLVPHNNPRVLADAVIELIKKPSMCRSMGESGREFVRREFSIDKMLQEIQKLYLSLVV